LTAATLVLSSPNSASKTVGDNLKTDQATLNKVLAEKRAYAKRLDEELDRIIAEEARRKKEEEERRRRQQQTATPTKPGKKPSASAGGQSGVADADRALTGSFVSNKGRLLFPVAGKYTIVSRFGKSNYGDLDHVEVNNSGIDISVAAGTQVRSVFDGEVSSIFFLNGYENVVIIRHGQYLTVYAGLGKISVSKGAKVKAGQNIGTVATSGGRTVLHFEVRKERTKLNPLEWVK
ncbi:MAG: M23 family metallopeptidase, partial [Muribaculaceae bacterium]|nr:M23 family metallopeptidase [Muribaculaceae bacterium]